MTLSNSSIGVDYQPTSILELEHTIAQETNFGSNARLVYTAYPIPEIITPPRENANLREILDYLNNCSN
jgi:hypothetical protein